METLEAGIEDVDVGFSPGVDDSEGIGVNDPGGIVMEEPGGVVVELFMAACPTSSPMSISYTWPVAVLTVLTRMMICPGAWLAGTVPYKDLVTGS